MISTPAISVIMSTYSRNYGDADCPNLLRRSIESIMNQTFVNFELILIDDGSKDGSAQVCQEYASQDDRIKYVRFDRNSGLPARRYNDGIALSSGKYITFMFDDDKWLPNALEDLYRGITHQYKGFGMVYGLVHYWHVENTHPSKMHFGEEWCYDKIKRYNFLANNSVIVERSAIDEVGGYDEHPCMKRLCDWDLWVRISQKYRVARMPILVGEVFGSLPGSIGITIPLNEEAVRERQKIKNRDVRLKGKQASWIKVLRMKGVLFLHRNRWSILVHRGHLFLKKVCNLGKRVWKKACRLLTAKHTEKKK